MSNQGFVFVFASLAESVCSSEGFADAVVCCRSTVEMMLNDVLLGIDLISGRQAVALRGRM